MTRLGMRLATAGLLAALACGGPARAEDAGGPWAELNALTESGYEDSAGALATLDARLREPAALEPVARRALQLARGLVAAKSGLAAMAESAAAALREAAAAGDPVGTPDAALVIATLEDLRGRNEPARALAQQAADGYEAACGKPNAGCNARARWLALHMLMQASMREGNVVAARRQAQAAADLAQQAGDTRSQTLSLALLGLLSGRAGEVDLGRRQLAQAARQAQLSGSSELQARVKIYESSFAHAHGEHETGRRTMQDALALARSAGAERLEAQALGNLSDDDVKRGRPREALLSIERALPVIRKHHDERSERVLLHNSVLARLGLGQLAEAKRELPRVLFLWSASGGVGDQVIALREFGDALAQAGDTAGALELYHRERRLAADIRAANRDSAVHDLRTRFDREAQQRNIDLLERDNALKAAQLDNRLLLQRVWVLVGIALALAAVMLLLLVRRVRETNRQLVRSHAWLRAQSERDALTGLANRRYFQDVMRTRGAQHAFDGALMLVDLDHFKQVNDRYGHGVGDRVLVDAARRIEEAVRAGDVVVRWGGEEFLVYAPGVQGAALDQLAARVLEAVGAQPVELDGGVLLPVTASIGYGGFPMPPMRLRVGWEQAVALVDMALYTAKNQGRNRAVGITQLQAPAPEVLSGGDTGFGGDRVSLTVTPGPGVAALA